jgi:pimeloyl-ACP methyl ester carboxylesterase
MSTAVLANHRRTLATLAISLVAAASIAVVLASSGHARTTATTKPTIVLVHGGWADASGWNAEVTNLEKLGYPVIAPANPLRGLASDADYLHSVLSTINGPIVLVGHSYGGAVITNAATGNDQVKALVYLNGWVPDEGESVKQLFEMNENPDLPPALRPHPITNPDGSEGVDFYIDQEAFLTAFAEDVDRETARVMAATQRPFAGAAFEAPSGPPAWKSIPSWYLLGTEDKAIPPATQRFMAERAKATIEEVPASHASMVSQPDAATKLILTAANATGAMRT